ncbi:MAG: VOC family protein [Cyclobacteriaceae bacterium]
MILHTGFVTEKLAESKAFYTQYFGFEAIFENEWFVMLKKGPYELAFMLPQQNDQHPLFQPTYTQGAWLALEVEDVDAEYARLLPTDAPILTEIKAEVWGDRHFVLKDPNGIGVDVFQRVTVMAN